MCIVNQQTSLSRYDFVNWAAMRKFTDMLPEPSREEYIEFIVEVCVLAKTSLQSALDEANPGSRIMASAVTMRGTYSANWKQLSIWLLAQGVHPKLAGIQDILEDLLHLQSSGPVLSSLRTPQQ
ncbi:hypothetical protein UY3_07154 [Chelonia mydas]|uniref:Uncharacterized protein n=1 Tax=Chelonia mydas TaxID=8469 RepID=M7BUA1_CHEMY|nr:hypothetical protein UY3_07154 [Chelonia mydas]